jgi:hypothetical protein
MSHRAGFKIAHTAEIPWAQFWFSAFFAFAGPVVCEAATGATGGTVRSTTGPAAEASASWRDAFQRPISDIGPDGTVRPILLGGAAGRQDFATGSLFAPCVTYALANGADALAIGDVTGDGRNDIVAVQSSLDSVYVYVQSPSGTLNPPVRYPAPVAYQGLFSGSVDIADMNQDGRLDVVLTLDNAVGVMLQTGGGLLSGPVPYPTVHSSFSNTYKIRCGDFDQDGLADVVSIDWGTQSIDADVFLQGPGGTLAAPHVYPVNHGGYDDLEKGDVSGDGRADIVVMSGQLYAYDNLGVLVQNGSGTFAPAVYYDLGGEELSSGVGIGDVNHDGRRDVVMSYGGNSPGAKIGVFLQDGTGHLSPPFSLPSYDIPQPVEVGDLNLDGRDDVVTLHGGWLALGVYLQGAGGTLAPEDLYPVPYASHYNRHALAIGDLNGDFLPDVAFADYGSGVNVLYNAGSLPTPVLTSLVSSEVFADRVELTWQWTAEPGSSAAIERSEVSGTWRAIGTAVVDGTHRVHFVDRDVEAGRRYGYRLGHEEDGATVFAGEVWVEIAASSDLAVRGSSPGPGRGRVRAWFTLPSAEAATLELLDLAGRRIAAREVGTLGAGEHDVDLTPERPLTPGIYWLRLRQGSDARTAMVAMP